ncbi:tRNA threonylcarbamoyladenosine biosynthesis protein TsaE [Nonlabens dokdonensis]|uniref:tRNA threonylcarbamoyladenosine biosynthesis protein TsaE n=2 Tax=Nonlabens dokdonensis TaxID=328515 RepID=L7WCN1_NONDD|nr:tRNA (adenosine(37)-N6)-threonylcarbamoyltransferase complex ATPase subunit type 1 TsaE [Nonlabens dokdonensis]AGC78002.1 putative ATP/GTP-binding transmembrane protein [Nonlabens dokdonensis DSW-6]PZX37071.1 tRNA threonylcarbamoyladenosine biosynthesis protein TsaE [Nonlabens dokdonensis]
MEITYNLSEIDAVAEQLLNHAQSKVILFDAPMGAGKTTLIKALCKQLGVIDAITSPTFSLVNEYKGVQTDVMHFDLYRIEHSEQLYDIGFEDYLIKNAFQLIEWPEFSKPFLSEYQEVSIEIIDSNTRKLSLKPLQNTQ